MRLFSALVIACVLIALPVSAHAELFDRFELSGSGYTAWWTLPANPAGGSGPGGIGLLLHDVAFVEDGVQRSAPEMNFYTTSQFGGFEFDDAAGEMLDGLSFTGAQLFRGSWSTAVFDLGTFTLVQDGCGNTGGGGDNWNCGATLRISRAGTEAAPEPSSLALLMTGAVGVVAGVRRWRVRD